MTTDLTRRAFLASIAAALLAACSRQVGQPVPSTPPTTSTPPPISSTTTTTSTTVALTTTTTTTTLAPIEVPHVALAGEPFTLGVASGDPTSDSVMLWTRLLTDPPNGGSMPADPVPVVWEVAAGPDFARLVATGLAEALPGHGHSVHIDVTGLTAAATYWYRFRAGSYVSPIGRTRTLPTIDASVEEFAIAFSSCQHYEDAHFTAWRQIAEIDLNLVVFLGDYIYETPGRKVSAQGRGLDVAEARHLADYRQRYAMYKLDPNLQAAHAAHPFAMVWDDHEVANNYGPLGLDPVADTRRAEAYQAWWEHMPVRLPPPNGPELEIHRTLRVGGLMNMWLLDTRQFRSPEPACPDRLDIDGLRDAPLVVDCEEVLSADRTMLGDEQLHWLLEGLADSYTTWNVLAQQVLMTSVGLVKDLPGPLAFTDKWGGYQWERSRILQALVESATPNPIVLTGDFHAAGVGAVNIDNRVSDAAVAIEFMAPPIASRFSVRHAAMANVVPQLPGVHYFEPYRGFATCEITPQRWTTTMWRVEDVSDPDSAVTADSTWETDAGAATVRRI